MENIYWLDHLLGTGNITVNKTGKDKKNKYLNEHKSKLLLDNTNIFEDIKTGQCD